MLVEYRPSPLRYRARYDRIDEFSDHLRTRTRRTARQSYRLQRRLRPRPGRRSGHDDHRHVRNDRKIAPLARTGQDPEHRAGPAPRRTRGALVALHARRRRPVPPQRSARRGIRGGNLGQSAPRRGPEQQRLARKRHGPLPGQTFRREARADADGAPCPEGRARFRRRPLRAARPDRLAHEPARNMPPSSIAAPRRSTTCRSTAKSASSSPTRT